MTRQTLWASTALIALSTPLAAQQAFELDEIIVTATTTPIEKVRSGASVEVLGEGARVGDNGDFQLNDALQRLPGVNAQQNGPPGAVTSVRIRGAGGRYNAVYIDGIKVNDPSSTSGQYGSFGGLPVNGLNRVEVLKGSQSALYGSAAVAGVINLFTLPDPDGPEGIQQQSEFLLGSYDTLAGSYTYRQNRGDLSLSFGLSHAQSDGFSAGDENLGNTEADGYRSNRLSFGLAYQASDAVRLGLNGFFSTGRSEFDEGTGGGPVDGTPGDERGERTERGLRVFTEIDNGGAWTHEVSLSYYNVDRSQSSLTVAPGSFDPFISQFEGERQRLDWQSSVTVNAQLSLSFGADYEKLISEDTSIPGGSARTSNRGVFAEAIYSPRSDLDVIAALRHDDNSQFGNATTGKLALSYRPTDALTLRGLVATGFRAPVPSELYAEFPDPLYPYFGNPNLVPEESESIELGLDWELSRNTTISTTAFHMGIDNLVQFAPCPVTIDFTRFSCDPGTFSTVENVTGRTTLQGFELKAEQRVSEKLNTTLAYTYLDAATADGSRLPGRAEHELFLNVEAALSDRVASQISVTHVADRALDTSVRPAQAMANYTVVDLGIDYALSNSASAYLTVNNAFDEQYQQVAGFGTAGRSLYVGLRADF
jgi:vitamin B12 transporter